MNASRLRRGAQVLPALLLLLTMGACAGTSDPARGALIGAGAGAAAGAIAGAGIGAIVGAGVGAAVGAITTANTSKSGPTVASSTRARSLLSGAEIASTRQ